MNRPHSHPEITDNRSLGSHVLDFSCNLGGCCRILKIELHRFSYKSFHEISKRCQQSCRDQCNLLHVVIRRLVSAHLHVQGELRDSELQYASSGGGSSSSLDSILENAGKAIVSICFAFSLRLISTSPAQSIYHSEWTWFLYFEMNYINHFSNFIEKCFLTKCWIKQHKGSDCRQSS